MNEASERLLQKFAELLKNNPNADVPFLWVQAGGKVSNHELVCCCLTDVNGDRVRVNPECRIHG